MVLRCLLAVAGILLSCSLSSQARAVDQLPMPHVNPSPVNAQIVEFASQDATKPIAKSCKNHLKTQHFLSNEQKIRAIKNYRECQAQQVLQQLAVWRWQDSVN